MNYAMIAQLIFSAAQAIIGAIGTPSESINWDDLKLMTIAEKEAMGKEAKNIINKKIDELTA